MHLTLQEYNLDKKARSYKILTEWAAIVGQNVAEVTEPIKIERGILTVKVASPTWKYELTMRKKEILSKIHAKHGTADVHEIHWK